MSAEALFTLTDLCGLPAAEAIASAVHTARTLTAAAIAAGERPAAAPSAGVLQARRHAVDRQQQEPLERRPLVRRPRWP